MSFYIEEKGLEDYKKIVSERINGELDKGFYPYLIQEDEKQLWSDYILNEAELQGKLFELTFNDKALLYHISKCLEMGEVLFQTIQKPTGIKKKII